MPRDLDWEIELLSSIDIHQCESSISQIEEEYLQDFTNHYNQLSDAVIAVNSQEEKKSKKIKKTDAVDEKFDLLFTIDKFSENLENFTQMSTVKKVLSNSETLAGGARGAGTLICNEIDENIENHHFLVKSKVYSLFEQVLLSVEETNRIASALYTEVYCHKPNPSWRENQLVLKRCLESILFFDHLCLEYILLICKLSVTSGNLAHVLSQIAQTQHYIDEGCRTMSRAKEELSQIDGSIEVLNKNIHNWRCKADELNRSISPLYDAFNFLTNEFYDANLGIEKEFSLFTPSDKTEEDDFDFNIVNMSTDFANRTIEEMKKTLCCLSRENRSHSLKVRYAAKQKLLWEGKVINILGSFNRNPAQFRLNNMNEKPKQQLSTTSFVKSPQWIPSYSPLAILKPNELCEICLNFLTFLTAGSGRFASEFLCYLKSNDELPFAVSLLCREIFLLKSAKNSVDSLIQQTVVLHQNRLSRGTNVVSNTQDLQRDGEEQLSQLLSLMKSSVSADFINFLIIDQDAKNQYYAWTSSKGVPTILHPLEADSSLLQVIQTKDVAHARLHKLNKEDSLFIFLKDRIKTNTMDLFLVPICRGDPPQVKAIVLVGRGISEDYVSNSPHIDIKGNNKRFSMAIENAHLLYNNQRTESFTQVSELFLWGYGTLVLDAINEQRELVSYSCRKRRRSALLESIQKLGMPTDSEETDSLNAEKAMLIRANVIESIRQLFAKMFNADEVTVILVCKDMLVRVGFDETSHFIKDIYELAEGSTSGPSGGGSSSSSAPTALSTGTTGGPGGIEHNAPIRNPIQDSNGISLSAAHHIHSTYDVGTSALSAKDQSIAETCLRTHRPQIVENPLSDPRYNSKIDLKIEPSENDDSPRSRVLFSFPMVKSKGNVNFIIQWTSDSQSLIHFGERLDFAFGTTVSEPNYKTTDKIRHTKGGVLINSVNSILRAKVLIDDVIGHYNLLSKTLQVLATFIDNQFPYLERMEATLGHFPIKSKLKTMAIMKESTIGDGEKSPPHKSVADIVSSVHPIKMTDSSDESMPVVTLSSHMKDMRSLHATVSLPELSC